MKRRYEVVATDENRSEGGIGIIWNPSEIKADYWIQM